MTDLPARLQAIRDTLEAAVNEPENNRAQLVFMVRATKDMARLLAAVEGVVGLHRETSQEFITGTDCAREECEHEDGCPVEPLPVCHHCWEQLEQIDPYFGEEHHVSEVMWPCPTVRALTDALGEK